MEENKALVIAIIDRMKTVLGVRMDKEVSDKLDGSRALVSVWKARGVIPFAECLQLAIDYNVSLDWLILGRGERDIVEPVEGVATGNLSEIPFSPGGLQWHYESGHQWFLPSEWIEGEGLNPGDLVAVRLQSDEMAPMLPSGQVVLVNLQGDRMGSRAGVCVVEFEGGRLFRRVQYLTDGSVRLSCDNPAYAVETIPAAERDRVKIVGYCHSLIKSIR